MLGLVMHRDHTTEELQVLEGTHGPGRWGAGQRGRETELAKGGCMAVGAPCQDAGLIAPFTRGGGTIVPLR